MVGRRNPVAWQTSIAGGNALHRGRPRATPRTPGGSRVVHDSRNGIVRPAGLTAPKLRCRETGRAGVKEQLEIVSVAVGGCARQSASHGFVAMTVKWRLGRSDGPESGDDLKTKAERTRQRETPHARRHRLGHSKM